MVLNSGLRDLAAGLKQQVIAAKLPMSSNSSIIPQITISAIEEAITEDLKF